MIKVSNLEHFVLTISDIDKTVAFYADILEFDVVRFGENRTALVFGKSKINLHLQGKEIAPHAKNPTLGSADLCFIVENPLTEVVEHLQKHHIPVESGIVPRTGACGPIESLYLRDPDGNLIELSRYL